jgi:hypothetical protein
VTIVLTLHLQTIRVGTYEQALEASAAAAAATAPGEDASAATHRSIMHVPTLWGAEVVLWHAAAPLIHAAFGRPQQNICQPVIAVYYIRWPSRWTERSRLQDFQCMQTASAAGAPRLA